MNFRLPILMIAIAALAIGAPSMGWSTDSSIVATKALKFPALPSAALPLTAVQSPTDEDSNSKFVLILKLDDNQINKLRIEGSLSTNVPPKFVNRVGAIRFQRKVSFLSDPLKVVSDKTKKKKRSVSVEVDNTILERLAYQPVVLPIYESGFNRVELKFNPLGMVAGELPNESQMLPNADSGPLRYIRINSRRGIYGTLKDFENLSIKTQFGKVDIPSAEISGIRFNDGNPDQAFIVLKKGDVFSGKIDLDSISVHSRWGNQKLQIEDLESITPSRETAFLRDAVKPNRWRLELMLPKSVGAQSSTANRIPIAPQTNSIFANPQFNLVPPVVYPQYQLPLGYPN